MISNTITTIGGFTFVAVMGLGMRGYLDSKTPIPTALTRCTFTAVGLSSAVMGSVLIITTLFEAFTG